MRSFVYRSSHEKFSARFFKKTKKHGIIKMLQENQQEKEKIMWIDDEALARKDRNQKRKFEMLKKIAITLAGIALVAGLAAGGAVGIFVGKRTEAKQLMPKLRRQSKKVKPKRQSRVRIRKRRTLSMKRRKRVEFDIGE